MTTWPDRLYELLPAVHQIRDGERGEPLRQVLAVVGEQVQQVQDDIGQLYDNWFIETCDSWVVPYLGDLVGYSKAENAGQPASTTSSRGELLNRILYPRREIANLVHRRRRKGTLSVLEDLAFDVAQWRARAVEFSRLIAFFQNVQFPQLESGRTFSLPSGRSRRLLDSPFDDTAHTIDVRDTRPVAGVGWYHPNKVGLFVWRRTVECVTKSAPCRLCSHRPGKAAYVYSFHRLGLRIPLYIYPDNETDETHLAEAKNLPMPLYRELLRGRDGKYASCTYYGESKNRVAVFVKWKPGDDPVPICAHHVHVCNLSNEKAWTTIAQQLGSRSEVAIDPECGLLLFGKAPAEVRVSYCYATTGDIGGGPYRRQTSTAQTRLTIRVPRRDERSSDRPPKLFEAIYAELSAAQTSFQGGAVYSRLLERCPDANPKVEPNQANKAVGTGVDSKVTAPKRPWQVNDDLCVELLGNESYEILADEHLRIAPGKTLEIRAASLAWPLIRILSTDSLVCGNAWVVELGPGSKFILDGLQVCGATLRIQDSGATATQCPRIPETLRVSRRRVRVIRSRIK